MPQTAKLLATIELENMEFYARHGCYELEKTVGNRFRVDVSLTYDAAVAALKDDIGASVNYLEAYKVVRRQMEIPSDILENVAKRIGDQLKTAFPAIETLTVKISKIAPPLGGKTAKVSVTVTL
ncbi:MAG: dihydroneopterin aldolase [Rikenellaceae bacterium]|nr:dihydroneopterin aldolase [Rikenellaceae bacterium]